MSPSELPVVRADRMFWPREGATAVALHRSLCPAPYRWPPGGSVGHGHWIDPGDTIRYVAGAWRCQLCAERIMRRDR